MDKDIYLTPIDALVLDGLGALLISQEGATFTKKSYFIDRVLGWGFVSSLIFFDFSETTNVISHEHLLPKTAKSFSAPALSTIYGNPSQKW
jgi:hypothetical protein